MKLALAQGMVEAAIVHARSRKMNPLAIVVLDARGALKFAAAEDGTSLKRAEIATSKAHGALAMGLGSRTLYTRVQKQPHFFAAVTHAADAIRREQNGDVVSFVVNRNINYTNVCYFKCQFCAFSKGKLSENLRGKPYDEKTYLPIPHITKENVDDFTAEW